MTVEFDDSARELLWKFLEFLDYEDELKPVSPNSSDETLIDKFLARLNEEE